MAHDYAYDYVFRPRERPRGYADVHYRAGERFRRAERNRAPEPIRGRGRFRAAPDFRRAEPGRERMGMHDFSERYGRYSGGYGYEYSPTSIEHLRHFEQRGTVGFTRPLRSRGGGYGRRYSGRRRIAGTGPARRSRPRRGRGPYGRSYWLSRGRTWPHARPV